MEEGYTFRDGGLHSSLLRALNVVGSGLSKLGVNLASLDPDSIMAAAVKTAGTDDFGSESYREPLEIYLAAARDEGRLSTFGRMAVGGMVARSLATRAQLWSWTQENPAAADEKIERPWVIVGLPRTGTSILSILLGLDPMARPLLQWEGRSPVPPATLATAAEDPRIAEFAKGQAGLKRLNPPFASMHPFGAMLAEECVPFFMLDLRTLGMETQAFVPSYGTWLQNCDMSPAYAQHKMALQALQTGQPTENWVLKTPNHLWCLETLREFYPDARIIWTHRDPGPVITSLASLNNTIQRTFTNHNDPVAVAGDWRKKARHAVESGMRYDDTAKPGWCVHVSYDEMMRDPLSTIRRIYNHYGDAPSSLHERRVEKWLAMPSNSGHGRHVYDPADFGWSYAEIGEEFSDYRARYGIESRTA